MDRGLWFALALVAVCASTVSAAEPPVDYDLQIRPILSDKCYRCHGPDAGSRQAEMRLDRRDGIPDETLAPGKPDESELLRRIMSDDEDERMPPPKSHLVLTDKEKDLIRRWIASGAEFTEHWSFRPLPTTINVPTVKDRGWPQGAIDAFVLSRLEAEGVKPSSEADPLRLLRRVTLDLTGLPPTPDEIRDFEAAATKDLDAAYAAVVDRLLANPAYGEHMAVEWLDGAQYADSYGYQSDQLNTQWPYRDWVVRAFNTNLPYDKFLTWQLAGDLLQNPTRDQILATAFNRLHRMTNEGGSIAEEWLVQNTADRVHTFGTATLGLTLECCRCHDHKFDPMTMRDYYSLFAFFNSIDENGMYDHATKVPCPSLLLPTDDQQVQLSFAEAEISAAKSAVDDSIAAGEPRFQEWLTAARSPSNTTPSGIPNLIGFFSFDGPIDKITNEAPGHENKGKADGAQSVAGVQGQAVRIDADQGVVVPDFLTVDRWDTFTLDFWLRDQSPVPSPSVVLQRTFGSDVGFNGFDMMLDGGHIELRIYRVWPGNGIGVRSTTPTALDEWQHLAVSYDGSSTARGLRLFLNGKEVPTTVLRDRIHKSAMVKAHVAGEFTLGARFRDRGLKDGEYDELRVYDRALAPLEIQSLHDSQSTQSALADVPAHLADLRTLYFSAEDAEVRERADNLRKARKKFVELEDKVQEIPVMEETPDPRPAYILARGAYDAPKTDDKRVSRDTFKDMLIPFPTGAPRDRLGLARWLTDPAQPLTSRVYVNRVWALFFGRGLVATPDNFGRQGAAPTHPELLDWLARDFVDNGWDIKRLCREILLSATYRQDSRLRPDLRERDPDNLLLARGSSRRLAAEEVRDVALAASGLMDRRMGGPPVSPYQPGQDLWRESNEMSPPYKQSVGKDLYRRSLYSVWKRTTPLPNMSAFDSPSREVCVVARGRTNTPLQALVLLNDVQFVEAARALAAAISQDHPDVPGQLQEAFLRLAGRRPDSVESRLLEDLYNQQQALFAAGADQDATKFVQIGESKSNSKLPVADLAALTAICQVILNLDATIYER